MTSQPEEPDRDCDSSEPSETHYVLLIHGTFAAPKAGKIQWYQCDSKTETFAKQLDERLAATKIGNAVLRVCKNASGSTTLPTEFAWSGDNVDPARMDAGDKLFNLIEQITTADPSARIHIVAHSHGGNVALRAMELYLESLSRKLNTAVASVTGEKVMEQGGRKAALDSFKRVFGENGAPLQKCPEVAKWLTELDSARSALIQAQQRRDSAFAPWLARIRAWGGWLKRTSGENTVGGGIGDTLVKLDAPRIRFNDRASIDYAFGLGRDRQMPELNTETHADLVLNKALNRLGRIVCLGTPFYEKVFTGKTGGVRSKIWWLLDVPLYVVFLAPFAYVLIIWIWACLWLPFHRLGFPGVHFNPFKWSWWAQSSLVIYLVLLACIFASAAETLTQINLYFRMRGLRSLRKLLTGDVASRSRHSPPLRALVISAGMLDEVLLAMSSEPFVFGVVSPAVNTWLGEFPKIRIITLSEQFQHTSQRTFVVALSAVFQATLYLPRVVLYAFHRRLAHLVDNRMLTIMSSAGFGLPIDEFEKARIRAVPAPLNVPCLNVRHWDISKDAARVPFVAVEAGGSGVSEATARYSFLWSDDELRTKCSESPLWKRIKPRLPEIAARYGGNEEPAANVEKRVAHVALTIEERVKEAIGAIELAHSGYYSNKLVLDAIAEFISKDD